MVLANNLWFWSASRTLGPVQANVVLLNFSNPFPETLLLSDRFGNVDSPTFDPNCNSLYYKVGQATSRIQVVDYQRLPNGGMVNITEPRDLVRDKLEFDSYLLFSPSVSHDGERIAMGVSAMDSRLPELRRYRPFIAVVKRDGSGWTPITLHDLPSHPEQDFFDRCPTWTPDGQGIVFISGGRPDCDNGNGNATCLYYRALPSDKIQSSSQRLGRVPANYFGVTECPRFQQPGLDAENGTGEVHLWWLVASKEKSVLGRISVLPSQASNPEAWSYEEYASIPRINVSTSIGVQEVNSLSSCSAAGSADSADAEEQQFICLTTSKSLVLASRSPNDHTLETREVLKAADETHFWGEPSVLGVH
jgi:hypothetical protein